MAMIAAGETPPKLVNYHQYLVDTFPQEGDNAEQNKAILEDRILSFARPGGPGSKFKNTQEKMLKALNLPKGAKEELAFGPEVADKVSKGLPLWEDVEQKKEDSEEDGEKEENQDSKPAGNLT